MDQKPTKTIANYEIIEPFQETSEWIFYQAFDTDSKKVVFLKVYLPTLKWDDELMVEFLDRLNYLKFFEHEYLLPILDFGKYNGLPYVIFPQTKGEFFDLYINKSIHDSEFVSVFLKIALAMNTLHTQDIVHGLISPASIFIDNQNRPLLLDYGISEILRKVLMQNVDDNFTNLSVTSIKFSSPEQLLGRSPQKTSDIYSYGILFYLWAFGELPIDKKSTPEVALFHLIPHYVWTGNKPRNVSSVAFEILKKCLKKNPHERFAGFGEIESKLLRMQKSKKSHVQPAKRKPIVPKTNNWKRIFLTVFFIFLFTGLLTWNYVDILFPGDSMPLALATETNIPVITPNASLATIEKPVATPSSVHFATATSIAKSDEEEKLDSPDTALQPYKPAIEGESVKINTIAISTENVRNIQEISRLGYGRPEDIAVSKKHAFAVASSAGVFIYDSAAGKLANWIDPGEWSTSVCFSSSGDLLAIGLLSGDIQIWNWQEDTLLSTLEKHKGKVSRVLFSSNDRFVYSASFDQDIIVWDLIAQEPLRIIRAHSTPIREIVVSSDGRYLASAASDQVIRLWDVSSGARLHEFSFPGRVEALAISPDDEYIAVGGESGFIRQWNIKTKQLRTDPIPVKARIFDIKYLSTNTLFAGIEGARHQTYSPQQLKYPGISLDFTAKPVASSLMRIFGPQFEFNTIFATFGDTSNVISAEWNGSLFRNKQVLWEPTYDIPDQLSFSPNSAFLATSGRRDIVKIWDIQASKLLYLDNSKLPSGNNISHDSAKVILIQPRPEGVSNVSEKYYLLDAKSKTRINLSDTLNSGSVSFTMDDSLLASANLSASNVWDVNTGYEVFFETRRDSNCWITFSANNDAIIQVNSSAGTFLEWDERIKNICLKSFGQSLSVVSENLELMAYRTTAGNLEIFSPNENRILWKYTPAEPISAISISPDGNIISIGTLSGKLLFMSAEDGELLFEKTGNYGALMNIKFSSQGNILATIGTDGTARLFSISHQP